MTPAVGRDIDDELSTTSENPLTPAVGRDTTTACGISGMVQYRSHNADRSKFRLLNVLPRTILGFPFEGKLSASAD